MEKQQQVDENFFRSGRRRRKTGGIVLVAVTAIAAALVVGWYFLDDQPGEVTVRPLGQEQRQTASAPLDLNAATAEELEALPGIGPALAERIISWREENGPFAEPEDITAVSGVGPAIYEGIASYIETGQEENDENSGR